MIRGGGPAQWILMIHVVEKDKSDYNEEAIPLTYDEYYYVICN